MKKTHHQVEAIENQQVQQLQKKKQRAAKAHPSSDIPREIGGWFMGILRMACKIIPI